MDECDHPYFQNIHPRIAALVLQGHSLMSSTLLAKALLKPFLFDLRSRICTTATYHSCGGSVGAGIPDFLSVLSVTKWM